ncbi:MAG: OmpH family outer membrane protein [bacterium]|nr:OmpH family outer membrane protein [bacterium]MBK8130305.1 OmpH family outer membrane protein [bacterium]
MTKLYTALILSVILALPVLAKEMKLGYIDSEAILTQYPAYQEAQRKLQEEEQKYIAEAQGKEQTLSLMVDEIEQQSLMLSAEARAEREQKIIEKRRELEQYRQETWGEGGKLYTKNIELSRPILERINQVIEKVSQQEGYDMVFDAAGGNIVYAQPQHDITELVLAELKKE